MERPKGVSGRKISSVTINSDGDFLIEDDDNEILSQGTIPYFKGLNWIRLGRVGEIFEGQGEILRPNRQEGTWYELEEPGTRRGADGRRIEVEPYEYIVYNTESDFFNALIRLGPSSNPNVFDFYEYHHPYKYTYRHSRFFYKTERIPVLKDLKQLCTDDSNFDVNSYIKERGTVVNRTFYPWILNAESDTDTDSESNPESDSDYDSC